MAARIVEEDFNTKGYTIDAMQRLAKHADGRFEHMVFRYWIEVYNNALMEVPVDTGALRASIRIQKAKPTRGLYERAAKSHTVETGWYIVAGGGGVINPKHRKEVNYARAVHDGYFSDGTQMAVVFGYKRKKKVGIGQWRPGNPFLTRAIQKTAPFLENLLKEYMNEKAKIWVANQPSVPSRFNIPTIIRNP